MNKTEFLNKVSRISKKLKRYPTFKDLIDHGISRRQVGHHFENLRTLHSALKLPYKKPSAVPNKDILLEHVSVLCKALKRYPTYAELVNSGITRDKVKHYFGNMTNLQQALGKSYPHISRLLQLEAKTAIYKLLGVKK